MCDEKNEEKRKAKAGVMTGGKVIWFINLMAKFIVSHMIVSHILMYLPIAKTDTVNSTTPASWTLLDTTNAPDSKYYSIGRLVGEP